MLVKKEILLVTSETFKRNNLDRSSSPYLLQHSDNPIWWQEWSTGVLNHAVSENKPLFVSIGYSTCHWCHVMAAEAFSDGKTAEYLNKNFVSIKIDREQRSDIDQVMMHFINSQNGNGGWPLNVFLTPDAKPIFALTYAPVSSDGGRMSFVHIAAKVHEYFEKNGNNISPFDAVEDEPPIINGDAPVNDLISFYDKDFGGFGTGQKFPPHSSILYLLYLQSIKNDPEIIMVCTKTLDAMRLRGLNDHLQGGIFRYCVDREWTIPHFEKMLYDQAMSLWSFSLGYRIVGKPEYKTMAEKILFCLDDSFEENGLYITAFNADTEHEEGATYLWSKEELTSILNPGELERFLSGYFISNEGNFEGKNHLNRRNDLELNEIEGKLLEVRKLRKQPSSDDKILCGINALVAVSMIQAARMLDKPELEEKASSIVKNLVSKFWNGSILSHSYYNHILQEQSFLFDAGAILTAMSMLAENDKSWFEMMTIMAQYVETFREDGKWIESRANDFQTVYASWFDHPVPSSISLAEMGLARAAVLTGEEIINADYRRPFQSDFYNIYVLMSKGLFHVITSESQLPWNLLPVNSLKKSGTPETDCYMGSCKALSFGNLQ
jgi:uncharacterized protein YyaL (SSP411 family)